MCRNLSLGLLLSLALSSGLWCQAESFTSPLSSPAISSLETIRQQMLVLQSNIASYKLTILDLKAQIATLQQGSETDKTLLIKLQAQLTALEVDLTQAQTLSKSLSMKYQSLAISYETARFVNGVFVPLEVVTAAALVASILTKGFTSVKF